MPLSGKPKKTKRPTPEQLIKAANQYARNVLSTVPLGFPEGTPAETFEAVMQTVMAQLVLAWGAGYQSKTDGVDI